MGKASRKLLYSLIAVVLMGVSGLALAHGAYGSARGPGGQRAFAAQAGRASRSFTGKLVRYLRSRGFRVNPGYPMLYAKDPAKTCQDYTYPALQSCLGANPAAPYVVAVLKSWPHEYVNRALVNELGPVRPGYSPTYRLHRREVIVLYGTMPPPGRYMGEQTWEWSQRGHWTARNYFKWAANPIRPIPMVYLFSTLPPQHPGSGRVFSFSAIGDPINNVVMQRRSGYSFGKNRYFIITPSATADRAVRRALRAQGIPDRDIFTQQIPSRDKYGRIGPLGMGKKAIDFNTWFRYAIPRNQQAAKRWRSRLPLTVLRVQAPASVSPVRRYGALHFAKRTAHSEAYLAGDMRDLLHAVCRRVGSATHLHSAACTQQPPPISSFLVDTVSDLGWTGPYCRHIAMNCDGDNPDTTFFFSKPLPLDAGQVYALADTLATQTHNATYVGLGVNNASTLFAPVNLPDTALKGSADSYARTVNHAGKFFVHYFTRHCAVLRLVLGRNLARDCTQITDATVPPRSDTTAFGHAFLRGRFMAGIRDYLAPGTERGPDAAKLLKPRILTFTGS